MYCEILSDKVIDISMFIKEKCVSENCNYIYSVDFNSNEYSSRWLRKRFFDHELVAFADIQNDEIKDMILIEKKQCEDLSYCNLLIFPWNKKTLLNYAIAEIYKENHQLTKLKLVIVKRDLNKCNIEELGFELELCIRRFNNSCRDIVSYASKPDSHRRLPAQPQTHGSVPERPVQWTRHCPDESAAVPVWRSDLHFRL